MSKYLISIVGPTAIGKTALSVKLAKHFKTEIISADSRQFFKELSIGTAVPNQEELNAARHHFIHHKSIHDFYNVGAFEKDALQSLNTLFESRNVVIMVGGSGLYIDAVTKGLDDFPEVDKNIRETLNKNLELKGLSELQNQLKTLDFHSYNTIAIDNPHRVIRALEICISSKKPYSTFINKTKSERPFKIITIGLSGDREIIYNRINERVDQMISNGLLDEVKNIENFKHLNALNTVGYKELFNYLDNSWSLDFAISEIKKNTRRFAKRQLTWFKKNENTLWFDFQSDLQSIINKIEHLIQTQ